MFSRLDSALKSFYIPQTSSSEAPTLPPVAYTSVKDRLRPSRRATVSVGDLSVASGGWKPDYQVRGSVVFIAVRTPSSLNTGRNTLDAGSCARSEVRKGRGREARAGVVQVYKTGAIPRKEACSLGSRRDSKEATIAEAIRMPVHTS